MHIWFIIPSLNTINLTINSINLTDNTLTQIIGTNGVGKSSIPLIVEEVLFNKNSKGVKKTDIPNRNINKGYSIFLSFTKDQEEYEIYVDRKSSIKVKLLGIYLAITWRFCRL